jgi:hypothetical protein
MKAFFIQTSEDLEQIKNDDYIHIEKIFYNGYEVEESRFKNIAIEFNFIPAIPMSIIGHPPKIKPNMQEMHAKLLGTLGLFSKDVTQLVASYADAEYPLKEGEGPYAEDKVAITYEAFSQP